MCGICGIWGEDARGAAAAAMVQAMDHRGPDDRGTYTDHALSFGMTRLAIIDVSPAGHQPMSNPEGSVLVVYNGELYNFREERRLLESKGHTFRSASDTEVVLKMYEQYGDDFLQRLRGMFALAVYDKRGGPGRERLLLARDHLGIKPLLYTRASGRLVFASEIKALLASGLVEPEVDAEALRLLLTYGSVNQPRTILKGVRSLPPAHRLVVENGRERVERYWSLGLDRRPGLRGKSYEEIVDEVAAALEESVRLQMVSDVPLGAFLSGGVDSSLLVAMMAGMSSHRVKTFSVGFAAEGSEFDETDEAERTARFLGTDHSRVVVEGRDVRDSLRHIAAALDQPSVDGVNTYFVSMAARRAVTVAISGTGGDELFAGYPWFARAVLDERQREAEPLRWLARSLVGAVARQPALDPLLFGRGGWRLSKARAGAGFLSRYAGNFQVFDPVRTSRMLAPEWRASAHVGRSPHYDIEAEDELPHGSPVERVAGLCLRGYTNNQLLRDIDAVSMSHSLEVRVPFMDPVVADLALSLPDAAKLGDLSRLREAPERSSYRETGAKRVLIDVGRRLLPRDFDSQPKRGFSMPFAAWMKGPLADVVRDALSPQSVRRRGLLDESEVSGTLDAFLKGGSFWAQPWLLMMLELWCRELLDRRAEAVRHVA